MLKNLTPTKAAFILAVVLMCVVASASWQAGWSMGGTFFASLTAATGFACITFAFVLSPHFAEEHFRKGEFLAGSGIAAFCVMLFVVEAIAAAMFLVGNSTESVNVASIQDTKLDDARKSIDDLGVQLAEWRTEIDTIKKTKPTVQSDTDEAIMAQIKVAQDAIDLEASKKGCKDRCLARKKEKADLEDRLATRRHFNDLMAKVETKSKELEGARVQAATFKHGDARVTASAGMVAKLFSVSLKPTDDAQEWARIGQELIRAMAFSIAAAVLMLIGLHKPKTAGGYRVEMPAQPNPTPAHHVDPVPNTQNMARRFRPGYVSPLNPGVARQVPSFAMGQRAAA